MASFAFITVLAIFGTCFADNVHITPKLPRVASIDPEIPPSHPVPPIITPRQSACSSNYAFSTVGQTATLYSPNYNANYPSGLDCKWYFTSPTGSVIKADCSDVNIPCTTDYIYFSLIGSSTFSDAKTGYCGPNGVLSQTSTTNKLNIGFVSGTNSGVTRRFQCKLTAVASTATTTAATTTTASTTTTVAPSTTSASTTGSSAATSSTGSTNSTCTCGVKFPTTRIVGGTEASAGEFPWRVLVFVFDSTTGQGGICGGTIISPNWILTAAHCTMNFKAGNKINVYYNTTANPVTTASQSQMITADRYVQNPAYSRTTLDNDLCLIHLPKPITYGKNVGPACLPYSLATSTFQGAEVVASGWGSTKVVQADATNGDAPSNTLLKVTLPVLTTSQCAPSYGTGQITPNMICTFKPNYDTCQGDSGGGIDYQNPSGLWNVIGVTSFGAGCATSSYPGVYAKVGNYLSWIEATTGENFCKK